MKIQHNKCSSIPKMKKLFRVESGIFYLGGNDVECKGIKECFLDKVTVDPQEYKVVRSIQNSL